MMIFDSFKDLEHAATLAKQAGEKFKLMTWICPTAEAAIYLDPIPVPLYPPVVLIERILDVDEKLDVKAERRVERFMERNGCKFVGT